MTKIPLEDRFYDILMTSVAIIRHIERISESQILDDAKTQKHSQEQSRMKCKSPERSAYNFALIINAILCIPYLSFCEREGHKTIGLHLQQIERKQGLLERDQKMVIVALAFVAQLSLVQDLEIDIRVVDSDVEG